MIKQTVRKVIEDFCIEFLDFPYLCYTEHGLHARFYCLLYDALPMNQRYIEWEGKRVCVIQKEYPTAGDLGKSRRQNWDISVIQSPPSSQSGKSPSYDYLTLDSVIEFGLNETQEHLQNDIDRLSHPDRNVSNAFIVHLYRISDGESERDMSPRSSQLLTLQEVSRLVLNKDVEVYFGISDMTGEFRSGTWCIYKNRITALQLGC